MVKNFFVAFLFIATYFQARAQLKSPEEFLGYPPGTHYTPHWKIVNYFQHVSSAVPTMVRLQQYGETNEGRPLLLSFISAPENIQRLELIRLNNLRLANAVNDKMAAIEENAPTIVWLSYNVHGNEASSSEAAMLTLFALVDPKNTQTKDWLKNTVVVIDPCINPDGRDRYVNWFNSVVGKNYNAKLDAREHREPWPGGRTNHYNFDLNRDWAWQTQIESKQRMKMYNQWMPHVHVDYHEQGVDAPYYFAPAAQPYHEVITPWQRNFQVTIGKNHAKYFDKEGWLYFTREIFDLYYPSYGDTYPTYNGAIGMTYEQGGGPAGGLGAETSIGDTLTLYDRIIHHYTTSLSTIEISSLNASRLVKEFHKFFNDAIASGAGEYKSYVIKNNPGDRERINALLDLLDKNNIQYSTANTTGKGFNYHTGKEESFTISPGDVVVNAIQPRSSLIKVLFEPKPKLVDSVTYDITAWALPYVYGLTTYASKDKINFSGTAREAFTPNIGVDAYSYVIRWQGVQSVRTISQLLQKGIRMRYAEMPFEVNGQKFERGSIIILRKGNEAAGRNLSALLSEVCNNNNVKLSTVSTGFVETGFDFGSSKVHPMKAPRVALITGEGINSNAAGEVWHFFEQQLDYPITLINANEMAFMNWSAFDVVIMPDGNYRYLTEKTNTDQLHDWVSRGGRIVALERAVLQLSKIDWSIKSKKAEENTDKKDTYEALRIFEGRERDFIPNITPGSIYKVELDNSHPLAFGYPKYYYTLKQDDNIYDFIKESGWNVGVVRKENQVMGFVGSRLREKLKDGLLFGVQDIGRGDITYLADDVLFRNFWENGKLMFCNAVFLVGQ